MTESDQSLFQRVKAIMEQPTDFDPQPSTPWTDSEFEEFARQEPLPPNQSFMLPSSETSDSDSNE